MITSVGAYVLGALDPADRADFEAHLPGCQVCRGELLRLSPLPGLLRLVDVEELEEDGRAEAAAVAVVDPAPPPAPRRRTPLVLAAAAAVVLALGGVGAYVAVTADQEPPAVTWTAVNPATGVRAELALTRRAWGTEVRISMEYAPLGKPCKLVVKSRDGAREVAGWWASGTSAMEVIPGSTSFDLSAIDAVEVVSGDTVVIGITPPG